MSSRLLPFRSLALVAGLALAAAGLTGCAPPTITSAVVVSNLDIPWDLAFTPGGTMVFTERAGRIRTRDANGTLRLITADLSDLYASGETGLMGIAVDPAFSANRRIYTCQGRTAGGVTDIRVVPWVFDAQETALTRQAAIVTGLPVSGGRHGGCRLRFAPDGRLWIGTGDAAIATIPQDLTSLGGKVLRVDRFTGAGVAGNPYIGSPNADTRRLWSSGHRNVQGLALRPADGSMWSVEHGPDRDDEVNRGVPGNFGWDPGPGYDESVPMTDTTKFPTAVTAAWSSGDPTVATSGATWLVGGNWGVWNDTLAVAALKDSSLRIMQRSSDGRTLTVIATILKGTYGRLRTAQLGPDGNLYLTTSNGNGSDVIVRVSPS